MTKLVRPREPAALLAAKSTQLAQDPTISLAAKGLHGVLRSLPEGADVSICALGKRLRDSEGSISRARKELLDAGYARETVRRGADGRVVERVFELFNESIASTIVGEASVAVQDADAAATNDECVGGRSNADRAVEDFPATRPVDEGVAVGRQQAPDGSSASLAPRRAAAVANGSGLQALEHQSLVPQSPGDRTLGSRTAAGIQKVEESKICTETIASRESMRREPGNETKRLYSLLPEQIDELTNEQVHDAVLQDIEFRVQPGNRLDGDTSDRIAASISRGELSVRLLAKYLSDPKVQFLSEVRRQLPALVAESQRIKTAAAAAEKEARAAKDRDRDSSGLEQERLEFAAQLQRLAPEELEQVRPNAHKHLVVKSRSMQLDQLISSRSLGEGIFAVAICEALRVHQSSSGDAAART